MTPNLNSDRLSRLIDLANASSDRVDEDGRLTTALVDALRASGLNRLYLPASLGGLTSGLPTTLDLIERVSRADASVGWCTCISAGSKLFAGYMDRPASEEVFARHPDCGMSAVFSPRGAAIESQDSHAYELSGEWPFASNVLHSSWTGVMGEFQHGNAGRELRLVFVPTAELDIEENWDSLGLRGTGSHNVTASAVRFDRARSVSFADRAWTEEPLWRLPIFAVLLPSLAAVTSGIARRSIDEMVQRAESGQNSFRGPLREDPIGAADLITADTALRSARAGLHEVVEEAWQQATDGLLPGARVLARLYVSSQQLCDAAVSATTEVHRLAGGRGAHRGDRLTRLLSDVQTARQHVAFHRGGRRMFAAAFFGDVPDLPGFFS